ncbi:MAG: hypothetical protein LC754_18955 [Acidobacteria bacterium]|nr:hypothetical protein [Acidobacteriota bacterium]
MQSLSLQESADRNAPPDLASEVARLDALLDERRGELTALQDEMREFKARYTQVVGSRMAELAEVECAIREAEARRLGVEDAGETEAEEADDGDEGLRQSPSSGKTSLRKLFWSVARLFHPDHATNEKEARRRHTVMAEASRAYREGDVESLSTLLGDEGLQSFCATAHASDEPEDLASRLINLKEELRTIEFGLKRIRQDGMHRLKLAAEEETRYGRDMLKAMAERINRQIVKARHRLEHLS